MNIKALITTFALIGSSSAAMARPATFTVNAQASWTVGSNQVVVRDHRRPAPMPQPQPQPVGYYDDYRTERPMFPNNNGLSEDASVYKGPLPTSRAHLPYYSDGYRSQWVSITAPTRIDRGRQFVTDLPNLGTFTTVRLQNVTGSTSIGAMLVRFEDGSEQVVQVNATLSRNNPVIDLRLDGPRRIHGFVINGSSAYGSAYQILAK